MRSLAILFGAFMAGAAQAQEPAPTPTPTPDVHYRVMRTAERERDRAALGISTQSTGKRDTLGLLVTMVTPGSPAEKAGIALGDRLVSIDSTSLKLAPGDAGERDMNGIMTRRLSRRMSEVKPGDDVTLVVYSGGRVKTVKVKTVEMSDLGGKREPAKDRAALGISFGGGSVRDSLGLFIDNVTPGGPAEKAGIEEGDRIAAINGVDVRVPAAEAGTGALVWGEMDRLTNVLAGVKPGDVVELKVWANGGWKTVKVTTVKGSELWADRGGMMRNFSWSDGDGFANLAPMAPMAPMPPMPPMHMRIEVPEALDATTMTCVSTEGGNVVCSNGRSRSSGRAVRVAPRAYGTPGSYSFSTETGRAPGLHAGGWNFGGLRLTDVTPSLASYFGAGSEKGLLVLELNDDWTPLKVGDVILTVNGRSVQRDGRTSLQLDTGKDNTFGILRKGKKMTVIVKAQ